MGLTTSAWLSVSLDTAIMRTWFRRLDLCRANGVDPVVPRWDAALDVCETPAPRVAIGKTVGRRPPSACVRVGPAAAELALGRTLGGSATVNDARGHPPMAASPTVYDTKNQGAQSAGRKFWLLSLPWRLCRRPLRSRDTNPCSAGRICHMPYSPRRRCSTGRAPSRPSSHRSLTSIIAPSKRSSAAVQRLANRSHESNYPILVREGVTSVRRRFVENGCG